MSFLQSPAISTQIAPAKWVPACFCLICQWLESLYLYSILFLFTVIHCIHLGLTQNGNTATHKFHPSVSCPHMPPGDKRSNASAAAGAAVWQAFKAWTNQNGQNPTIVVPFYVADCLHATLSIGPGSFHFCLTPFFIFFWMVKTRTAETRPRARHAWLNSLRSCRRP